MPDPRSLMQEFRLLDQKRQGLGLSQTEEARHAELKELVGSSPAPPVRSGFNVTAAAAQLRESLLPAGLRSRPLDAPVIPAPPLAPAYTPPPQPAVESQPALRASVADSFFDPASLGQEARPQAWNPEAPGYDPDAPYDEAAWIAAGYDPNATYDWAALGYDVPQAEPALTPADETPPDALPEAGFEPAGEETLEFSEEPGSSPAGEPAAPEFGEYDAPGPSSYVAPVDYGGPEGDSIPGGEPLELGDAPIDLQPEEALDASFELASDGSFGESAPPGQLAPWAASQSPEPSDGWESAQTLDLAAPYQPAAEPPVGAETAVSDPLTLEPEPEAAYDAAPAYDPAPAYEPAPEFNPGSVPELLLDLPPAEPEAGTGLDPLSAEPLELPPETGYAVEAAPEAYPSAPAPMELEPPPPEPIEEEIPAEIAAAYAEPAPAMAEATPAEPAWEPPPAPAFDQADPEPIIEPYEELPEVPVRVAGTHRVVVHTIDGQVKRGLLSDASLDAPDLPLDTQGPSGIDVVATAGIKAIFFMLAPGERAPVPEGKKVRVTFRDGRQVAGFSPDYQEGSFGFFMIPADTRTNTGRIWVYQAAVRAVIAG